MERMKGDDGAKEMERVWGEGRGVWGQEEGSQSWSLGPDVPSLIQILGTARSSLTNLRRWRHQLSVSAVFLKHFGSARFHHSEILFLIREFCLIRGLISWAKLVICQNLIKKTWSWGGWFMNLLAFFPGNVSLFVLQRGKTSWLRCTLNRPGAMIIFINLLCTRRTECMLLLLLWLPPEQRNGKWNIVKIANYESKHLSNMTN